MRSKTLLLSALVVARSLLPLGVDGAGQPAPAGGAIGYQETNKLYCQGQFWGYTAIITGRRLYEPYNALGDGYVQFVGEMRIGRYRFPMTYEGYTNDVYKGYLRIGQQSAYFSILDNTGGRMIIYEGRVRLTAPEVWGEFVCRWS